MKLQINFKTPDVLGQLTREWYSDEEWAAINKAAKKFIRYGEEITCILDTEKKTMTIAEYD